MSDDRRTTKRFSLVASLAKPVSLRMASPLGKPVSLPGIMANISAGGMALITFFPLEPQLVIDIILDLPGFKNLPIKSQVVRVEEKQNTYMLGIRFLELEDSIRERIALMAEDYEICEMRWLLREKKPCFPSCNYHPLCRKSIKKNWKKPASKARKK